MCFRNHWTCVDIDWKMFAACYIQLSLLGIPAAVLNANSLTLEQFDAESTIIAALHPMRRHKQIQESAERLIENAATPSIVVQKTLF